MGLLPKFPSLGQPGQQFSLQLGMNSESSIPASATVKLRNSEEINTSKLSCMSLWGAAAFSIFVHQP